MFFYTLKGLICEITHGRMFIKYNYEFNNYFDFMFSKR